MKKQNIEDIFSSMENFSSVPPPELWDKIEEKLDKPKKKKRAVLWWSAAACLLLGLMLPSVLHFNSGSGIKPENNGSGENNSVVLDEKKTQSDDSKTRSVEEIDNKNESINKINKEENAVAVENSADKDTKNTLNPSQINQNQKTTVNPVNTKNKSNQEGVLNEKSNLEINKPNQAVADRSFAPNNENGLNTASKNEISNSEKRNSNQAVAGKSLLPNGDSFNSPSKFQTSDSEKGNKNQAVAEKSFVPNNQNTFNSVSKTQALNPEKKNANQVVAEKSFVPNNQNTFNSASKNQVTNPEKKNANQIVAEKSFVPNNQNTFNSASKNQMINPEKKNSNQVVAEKSFVPNNQNTFNSASKNQVINPEKKNTNQAVAQKSFHSEKENGFNSVSKNQVPSSIFEDKLKAKNNIALNAENSVWNNQKSTEIVKEPKKEIITNEKAIADNQKSNSKFNTVVLSKQDSVQLAELQNLEKGIITPTPETKKEKEDKDKRVAKNEKWDLAVFAGVANSENYKNEKTLGNVNDSKQSNSYGVKTKYKINKKWAVSSGIKFNELGQSIANVSYMKTSNAFLSSNDYFNPNATLAAQEITKDTRYIFVPTSTTMALKSDNIEKGNLDQSLRYLEVPLEVSYSVFNKNKTNISLNTGGFVGKLISNNMALNGTSIGENANANDYVYGSTLSTTVQYRIYKKTNVFVEPAMNYYINPLTEQSFNQFQWGFNFGLNISF
ncbi:hypothetical protein IRZ71_20810 [Flavobacterium sp. ANB]|uniref:hypothetical protein n=1 Tax=unclassified Flavobacterium TaxID=196869 RepID=UPI0012B6E47A|nr:MULTISPECIES: hypothetical protein [unclassified Flavobacterium]MBF4518804.1 hypothetical protein [Flavobacterium sp. ANB]MTD71483.1 hypothetical protein [Flavobacterium sp. LC2016-13]